jgi:hypothetical protein
LRLRQGRGDRRRRPGRHPPWCFPISRPADPGADLPSGAVPPSRQPSECAPFQQLLAVSPIAPAAPTASPPSSCSPTCLARCRRLRTGLDRQRAAGCRAAEVAQLYCVPMPSHVLAIEARG